MDSIFKRIANELNVKHQQVEAAVTLLDEGATVPFISRYRKEVTGGLDDTQMRNLEERLRYLRELEDRRVTILKSIDEQGKLTPELATEINAAETKNILEDLYLPYKPKRRTKGQIAREAGLEPLADALFENPQLDPEKEAVAYISEENGVKSGKDALDGAKFILMERFSEDAKLINKLRTFLWTEGTLSVRVVEGKEKDGAKFSDYFEHDEPLNKIPSHRALAIFRGRNEGILQFSIKVGEEEPNKMHPCEMTVRDNFSIDDLGRPADKWLTDVVRWTWRVKLLSHLETDLMSQVKESAEEEAIKVFAKNLKDVLLAAPAGQKATIGLDPGLRTGVKVAVIDATGQFVDNTTVYPHAPQNRWDDAIHEIAVMCKKYSVELISIGNGTASRETDKLVGDLMKRHSELNVRKVMVSEAGASIYSASEFAAKEFPNLDVTVRGAISIARRLQDPLSELVKIEPKSIGVGQYQHDVNQSQIARALDAVVEDCVNGVGVDVNTASIPLLTRVSGLNSTIANNIVEFRNQNGAFSNRSQLKKIPRLGEKAFEQCAGFLRISNGENPLDASSVHPESYPVVTKIAEFTKKTVKELVGDSRFLKTLDAKKFVDEHFGLPTVTDIINELEKPGRDPRPEFKTADFKEGVETLADLKPDMILEGTVTNVTNFGAFVDIGVHQDGLVHISALSHNYIKDPREVVKAGDIVKVKVMEVDLERKRIGLSMRLDDSADNAEKSVKQPAAKTNQRKQYNSTQQQTPDKGGSTGTFAALFADAKKRQKDRT